MAEQVRPNMAEERLGIVSVTIADVDGVKVAVARTRDGFRSAGVSTPSAFLDDGDFVAAQRARSWATERLRRIRRHFPYERVG